MTLKNLVYYADNLSVLSRIEDESIDLVYIDPPFNTGKVQSRKNTKAVKAKDGKGSRKGFCGKGYDLVDMGDVLSYTDSYSDQYLTFLKLRLSHVKRILKPSGSVYLHLDYREVHYAKVLGDSIFGRDNFLNEIVWAYDYGAKPKTRWPAKHDTILMWVKSKGDHLFNVEDIDRIPYMAPGMVSKEKAARGKLPTDCWWHTIVAPTGKEKTGYPTQKPLGVLERIIRASSPAGGTVLDFFAGSGTTGEAALKLGRQFILVDSNDQAIKVIRKRLAPYVAEGHKVSFIKKK